MFAYIKRKMRKDLEETITHLNGHLAAGFWCETDFSCSTKSKIKVKNMHIPALFIWHKKRETLFNDIREEEAIVSHSKENQYT